MLWAGIVRIDEQRDILFLLFVPVSHRPNPLIHRVLVDRCGNETPPQALKGPLGGATVLEDGPMKRFVTTAALAATIAVSGCATNPYNDPYANNDQARRAATGAALGGAAGAVAGAVIPGVSTVEGAVAGAVLGGVLGAVVNGRQYYRDTRGYCYYVDQYGRPVYD